MGTTPRLCYEIFVRSFCDSNGDGIGDLQGIISKLDYLQEFGVEAIWLTPVHPSPSYHKYDVTDYYSIDPEFGTLADFQELIQEAHKRKIAVLLDLIINHTSTTHPWFLEAAKGSHNEYRNYYWWKTQEEIDQLGIASRQASEDSQEVYPWHDIPGDPEMYYGLFFSGMPDLNFHSAALRNEFVRIMTFWLIEMEVDGFRIDAARHIYPTWEQEHNHTFWSFFKEAVQKIKQGAFTVGEIWAGSEEVAPYYQGLHATFNFDLSFKIQELLVSQKNNGLIEMLLRAHRLYASHNRGFIDAIMLTNHDQERIASVVKQDIKKVKQAASILLTLPGQPYLYYGEELGMLGTKPDPHIREPFLWSSDPSDKARPNWIEPIFSTMGNVTPLAEQQKDPGSIWNHYKKLIDLRLAHPALNSVEEPNITPYQIDHPQVLAFTRQSSEEQLLIIHYLGSHPCKIPFTVPFQFTVLFSFRSGVDWIGKRLLLKSHSLLVLQLRNIGE
ncbi:alpha-amylase family glycosyl hydrolase [Dyadobacter tibetensis]|uniref:alpha-amylase family glycosyl hydrolase n=1 Tax=Dyadobacter tibetensis TaxID=1211851 RepID=UPI0004BB663B|nr:alpha-amylase family glycosyl hydrolase [Dyadobacter tibetensis]